MAILVEGKALDKMWISEQPKVCSRCKDHKGCSQKICVNDNGHAKSFSNVCDAMRYLYGKKDINLIAVGLGICKDLYQSIYKFPY